MKKLALVILAAAAHAALATTAHADQLARPWVVWQKVSSCAENRVDWMTVAQDDPTMYGLNFYRVADGYVQTFDFTNAMAQMATLRQGAAYDNTCCTTWSVWQQAGTNQRGVVHNAYNVAQGWMFEAGDMCCENAMDRAGIAGGCGTGLPLTQTTPVNRNPPPPPGGGNSNKICDLNGICFDLGGNGQAQAQGTFTGTFQSAWGNIYLTQSGATVTGHYDHDGGRIEGTVSGNVLTYRWSQKSGRRGIGTFTLGADGGISGPWSYVLQDGSVAAGGTWGGKRI